MTGILNLFIIGVDASTLELIRSSLEENKIIYKLTFFQEVSEIKLFAQDDAEAVFLYSNRSEEITVEEIKKINQLLPKSSVVLMTPKVQLKLVISSFRAGLFDFISLPFDKIEMKTVIYRLKLHGVIRHQQLSPERALLQYFARPENFTSVDDVHNSLMGYLGTFFKYEREINFFISQRILTSLAKKLQISTKDLKKLESFLSDPTGLVFGLKLRKNRFYFLIKSAPEQVCYIVAKNSSPYPIRDVLSDYLTNLIRTSLTILDENTEKEQFKLLTFIDDVTGLYNQRKLIEDLEKFMKTSQTSENKFSLLFIDIDHFKNVNDRFGHVVGSKLLVDLADVLKSQLRSTDIVYRYGGDEFIILLPNTDILVAKKIALRMSLAVKNQEFEVEGFLKYRLSLSIGLASYPEDAQDPKKMITFADQMMYLSKRSGRGKVFHIREVIEE